MMKRRRICWPTPDEVCLQGGCLYCNDRPFRTLLQIRVYAREAGYLAAYNYGEAHDFWNAEVSGYASR
jgi:hypothetical protein